MAVEKKWDANSILRLYANRGLQYLKNYADFYDLLNDLTAVAINSVAGYLLGYEYYE